MVQQRGNPRASVAGATAAVRRGGVVQFFRETYAELKRSTWPNREETTRLTVIVLIISVALGGSLGLIDWLFNFLFQTFVII